LGPGDRKGEEDAKPAGEGERMLPDDGIPNPSLEEKHRMRVAGEENV